MPLGLGEWGGKPEEGKVGPWGASTPRGEGGSDGSQKALKLNLRASWEPSTTSQVLKKNNYFPVIIFGKQYIYIYF